MTWQPIKTHPKKEQFEFLVWMPTETPPLAVALWDSEAGLYFAEDSMDVDEGILEQIATHWRPMLDPPKEGDA